MRTKKPSFYIRCIAALFVSGVVFMTHFAFAQDVSPVVVEMFGQNDCVNDLDMQKQLYDLVKTHKNVIVLNCRTSHVIGAKTEQGGIEKRDALIEEAETRGVRLFYNEGCTQRESAYTYAGGFGQSQHWAQMSLLTIVNGQWPVNRFDISPAVKMGRVDLLASIAMQRKDEVLHVTLPDSIELDSTLTLFVYAPSTGVDVGAVIDTKFYSTTPRERVNQLLQEQDGGEEEQLGQEEERLYQEALAKKQKALKETAEFFFRPVAGVLEIPLDGTQIYDVSLSTIVSQTGLNADDLGYVAVLQEGSDGIGRVLATGEIVPVGERFDAVSGAL